MAAAAKPGRRPAPAGREAQVLISLCLLGVFVWFLLSALEQTAEQAERVGLKLVLNQLRAALVIKGAEVHLSRRERYQDWRGSNPMMLLQEPVAAYSGLCGATRLAAGQWCFAELNAKNGRGILVYQPGQPITTEGQAGNRKKALAWSVAIDYADSNSNGQLDKEDRKTGLKLMPATKRNRTAIDPNTGVSEK
ncbi:MAG: hypothetical protein KGY54_14820 [Oleiphilaceae bacterium]|nr:hypothetical protein [Oleiphilaceae bacterium]